MTTNRARRSRASKSILLDDSIIQYFLYGNKPDRNTPARTLYIDLSGIFDDCRGEIARAAWLEHRNTIFSIWKTTGGRGLPWGARMFDHE